MEYYDLIVTYGAQFIDFFIHLDQHLASLVANFGFWTYAILFLIVFAETGFIVTPFLPGDSLLFAIGAISALESSNLNVFAMALTLIVAAILGDFVNYSIGYRIGPQIFKKPGSRLFNPEHLIKTELFYKKHGAKTIVIARFMPIIRTFAPFVAGIGKMPYRRFSLFNIFGAVTWVLIFIFAGFYFGNIPTVKRNFTLVIFAVIALSVMPLFFAWLKSQRENRSQNKKITAKKAQPKPLE